MNEDSREPREDVTSDSREAHEILRQNPEAGDRVAERIKVVIGCLEEMLATAQRMLADLEKLGRPE